MSGNKINTLKGHEMAILYNWLGDNAKSIVDLKLTRVEAAERAERSLGFSITQHNIKAAVKNLLAVGNPKYDILKEAFPSDRVGGMTPIWTVISELRNDVATLKEQLAKLEDELGVKR